MPTGACGINCDACRLQMLEVCSTCGPGTSQEAQAKMAAQQRLLGAPCPILACAIDRGLDYCLRDCDGFPCDLFSAGPYPFSQGFLSMQERRRRQKPSPKTQRDDEAIVASQYWDDLSTKDPIVICKNALAFVSPPHGIRLPFLGEDLLLDKEHRVLQRQQDDRWETVDEPLLEMLCLVYLLHVGPEPLCDEMVGVHDLKSARFFRGPHELKVRPLVERYGNDLEGFNRGARRLGGELLNLADAACRLWPFPKIPIYYLLWQGDEEFEPRLSVLFDRSIDGYLQADVIWALTTVVTKRFLKALVV